MALSYWFYYEWYFDVQFPKFSRTVPNEGMVHVHQARTRAEIPSPKIKLKHSQ